MRKWNKILALLLAMIMAFGTTVTAFAEGEDETDGSSPSAEETTAPAKGENTAPAEGETAAKDIVILHTNDVHGEYKQYAKIAAYKADMAKDNYVTLVDAGDFTQGAAIAILSKGEYLVDIINKTGYDIVAPGNHEFDYGMEQALKNLNALEAAVISCNFVDLKEDKPVFDAYKIVAYGETKIAFVGISTPETYTKSTPTYFQDENGNYIYSFCENELYTTVQSSVDAARAEGVDYVVAVGHMGVDEQSSPWTSKEVIANTTGIDVFIDGHSHTKIENEQVTNKDGKTVVLAQTGDKLKNIGKVTIKPDGTITAELISDYEGSSEEVTAYSAEIEAKFKEYTSQVVAKSEVDLIAKKEDGSWAVRVGETNMGDLIADAYRIIMDTDIGIMNGGGIRADIKAGDVAIDDILAVMTFGNMATAVKATGQQILDCLEMGASAYPGASGGFTHVSGLTYTIDTTIESSIVKDDKGYFASVDGPYRVKDVMVNGEPIDLSKTYTVACHSYWLTAYGDGMTMFQGCEIIPEKHEMYVDNVMLKMYIEENLNGVITAEQYGEPQGRITIKTADETVMTRGDLAVALYELAGSPEVTGEIPFTDIAGDAVCKNAVIWASQNEIIQGYPDGTFRPDASLLRQDLATILFRYDKAEAVACDLSAYTDAAAISDYAVEAVKWAVSESLLNGTTETTLSPVSTLTNDQVDTLLARYAEAEAKAA